MFPDSNFAEPVSSFSRPVPVPLADPTISPLISVSLSCAWLPYVRGALQQLLLQTTWDTDDPAVLALTQARANMLIDLFQECTGGLPPVACDYSFNGISSDLWSAQPSHGDLTPGPMAAYVPLSGWTSVMNYEPGGNVYWQACAIHRVYNVAWNVHGVFCAFHIDPGNNYLNGWHDNNLQLMLFNGGSLVDYQNFPGSAYMGGGDFTITHDFAGAIADEIVVFLLAGVSQTNDDAGRAVATTITTTGNGSGVDC